MFGPTIQASMIMRGPLLTDALIPLSTDELIPLLGEIRDQLKRIANVLEGASLNGEYSFNVEIGEPTIRLREKDIQKITDAIRGYVEK